MKLFCTCGECLTRDLYYSPSAVHYLEREDIEPLCPEDNDPAEPTFIDVARGYIGRGSIVIDKEEHLTAQRNWKRGKVFKVNPDDLVIPRPAFKGINGCCDFSHEDLHCTCGKLIGELQLDCWQSCNYVSIFTIGIHRRYPPYRKG